MTRAASIWQSPPDMDPVLAAFRRGLLARLDQANGHGRATERRLTNDTARALCC